MEIPYIVHCFPFCSIVQYLMFIIVLLYSFPLFSNVERSLLLFFGILYHFPVLFKIVNSSSALLYPSLPPPALSTALFPLLPSQGFCSSKPLHKFLFKLNTHIYIHTADHFNWVTMILCSVKKKIVKAHFRIHFSWPWSKFWCRLSTEYGF